jgi:Divergent InlB B-repeat domain
MIKTNAVLGLLMTMSACLATAACVAPTDVTDSSGSADDHTGQCAVLTVSMGPSSGAGDVTSDPAGIQCPTSACWASYGQGQTVTLTEKPLAGWRFVDWEGDCSGTGETTTVTLDNSKACTARFAPIQNAAGDGGTPAADAGAADGG